jgi:hypothetical protein
MTPDDVDVDFFPREALPAEERDAWCRIITAALADEAGALSVVFTRAEGGWVIQGFHWFRPGGAMLQAAGGDVTAPLRERAAAALRAAGKPLVGS